MFQFSVHISVSLSFAVMRRNPFMADGCCRKGSRNALQELYNPSLVGSSFNFTHESLSCLHTHMFTSSNTYCIISYQNRCFGNFCEIFTLCLSVCLQSCFVSDTIKTTNNSSHVLSVISSICVKTKNIFYKGCV